MNISYPPFCFHRTSLLKMPTRAKTLGAQRAKHAHLIVKRLVKRLGSHDHETRMHSTNRLLPPGSLKRTSLRKNFGGWAKRLCGSGRVLTKTLSKEVCFSLRQHFGLENPAPMEEVIRLHNLMKQARKRKLEVRKSATAMGDNVDTLPYEARCLSLFAIKLQQQSFQWSSLPGRYFGPNPRNQSRLLVLLRYLLSLLVARVHVQNIQKILG